ncbi:MAG: sensor histidine kinase KdpD [Bdellovibrionales bacterium]
MTTPDDQRPSPEALLEQANREARGKLKIFLGAAPGVGKTYAMLRAAQERKRSGMDVVVGLAETHRRRETDELLHGLEIVPRRQVSYRGVTFQEMDIDAILKRRPQLVLVDELAHTNVEGLRHLKRHQDVEEILDAGIDVYSTLNIQHIESLNDIVARITGVTVRETVPDSIMQKADSIELIDLTPEELLQRMKEGKVYIPDQARLAMNRFFSPGNLTALRELALRQAAERVDEQMASYMKQHAIAGPWPTSDRVLVCIADDGQASALVRTGKRSAERRRANWTTLYIENHRHATLPEETRRDIARALHLTETLGGEAMTIAGEDIPAEILRVARDRNVSMIIIGKSQRTFLSKLSRPSVATAILEQGDNFDILVMNGSESASRKSPTPTRPPSPTAKTTSPWWTRFPLDSLVRASFTTLFASALAWSAAPFAPLPALLLIYLLGLLLVAVDHGWFWCVYATMVSALTLDFLCLRPRYSFAIASPEDALTLIFFTIVGLAVGFVGDRLRRQIEVTRRSATRTQSLYDFSKILAAAATLDDISLAIVNHAARNAGAKVALLVPRGERLESIACVPPDLEIDTASDAALDWAFRHGRPAGLSSDTLPGANFYGLPLLAGKTTVGVLAVRPQQGYFTSDQERFLAHLASQSAVAIERSQLATAIEEARVQAETERLRSGLLSSISHDLRTPLVAILGATTSLRDYWDRFDETMRRDLFATIEEEADRLNRFVQNLLDMTQLMTGGLTLKRRPIDVQDLVGSALSKLAKQLGKRPLRLDIAQDLPPIDGDLAILERVLINVIDNACKYAPEDQPLTLTARREGPMARLTITDRGPGIPEDERERVFDMFYRVKIGTAPMSGAGLGLAICRGFIEAHGGRIAVQSGFDGTGTQIVLRLPLLNDV